MRSLRSLLLRENHVCPWWLAYTFDNPLRRLLHDPVLLLGPHVREGMTVADIGCGMGYFSLAMAGMVGGTGAVLAVDIQQKMLDIMRKRADKAGVADRIRPLLATHGDIGIREPVDFVLAFWVVHEVGDPQRFFGQVFSVLKQTGKMLMVEPKVHVSRHALQESLQAARDAGFRAIAEPKVRLSRAALLGKGFGAGTDGHPP